MAEISFWSIGMSNPTYTHVATGELKRMGIIKQRG